MSASRKTWLITGASSGFGLSLTEKLLARGDGVAATVRAPNVLAELAARYPDTLHVLTLDVTDAARIPQVVDEAVQKLGKLDIVVSNAGYALFGALEEASEAQIERQIETNLLGSIRLIRAVVPVLRAQGAGRILQLSSMGGQISFPGLTLYHATKWGVEGLVEGLFDELAPFGIQLTLVEPGGARTKFASTSADVANGIAVYEDGPVGGLRRSIAAGISRAIGDPEKMADAMIACADQIKMPRRLTLGSDAYKMVRAALNNRLAELDAAEALAKSTDLSV